MININQQQPTYIESLVYKDKLHTYDLEEAKVYFIKDLTQYPCKKEKMLLIKKQEHNFYNSKKEFIFCSLETNRCHIFESPFEFEVYNEY